MSRAESADESGGGFEYVTADECADWRNDRAAGASISEIIRDTPRSRKTVTRHLYGREQCSHDDSGHPDPATPQTPDATGIGNEHVKAICDALRSLLDRNLGDCTSVTPGDLQAVDGVDMIANRVSATLAELEDRDRAPRGLVVECVNPDANRRRFRAREAADE